MAVTSRGRACLQETGRDFFFNYVWNSLNKCCCVACIAFFVLLFIFFFTIFFLLIPEFMFEILVEQARRRGRGDVEGRINQQKGLLPNPDDEHHFSSLRHPATYNASPSTYHTREDFCWPLTIRSAFDSFGPFARSNATVPLLLNYLLRYCRLVIGSLRWLVVCAFSLSSTIVFWMHLLP